jgi:hypothetical protein
MLALGVVLAALLAPARRAVATITEIDLADIPEPVSRATLERERRASR